MRLPSEKENARAKQNARVVFFPREKVNAFPALSICFNLLCMAAWTLAQAQAKVDEWMAAETKVAEGQSYMIAGRAMTRADLGEIREQLKFWAGEVNRLSTAGGIRIRTGVPL